ncbi:MAG: peptidoglycan-binding protein [Fibrobacterota bacterium]|nr:peptidoglycan-binding protein [Fibrobacterota bacterium]QQS06143.1 MAG: peptidoglycan-binding protein [Fibrobacterota bacterium]
MNKPSKPDAFRQIFRGGNLLDESKAKPSATLDWEKVQSKLAASRSVNKSQPKAKYDSDAYLKQCREEDPWPEEKQEVSGAISLSDCKFAFPSSLYPDRDALVQCKVTQSDPPTKGSVTFKLWVRTEGEQDWNDLSETATTPVDAKAGESQLEVKLVLHCPTPPPELGTKLEYRATAEEASGSKAESAAAPVKLQNLCRYLGAPHLSYKDRHIAPVMDEDGKWALGLAAVLQEHAKTSGATLVAFGFAKGQSARDLAKYRAQWVQCVLSRDKAAWETLRAKMDTKDLQSILSGLCLGFDWSCDPGAVDGKTGAKTTAAIKGFQSGCEARLGVALKSDGDAGKKTWEALLDALCHAVGKTMGDAEKAAPSWPAPTWGHAAGKGVYSNGADIARAEDVGVEVGLFEAGMEPALTPVAAGKKVDPTSNPMEDSAVIQKFPLDVAQPAEVSNQVRRVRMVGMVFDANKGFVLPQALPGIRKIVAMNKAYPAAKMLVVGHAESDEIHAGIDLARHRAEMLTAYLVGKHEPWLACFGPSQVAASRWGTREIQLMLSALDNGGKPFFEGCASGITDEKTKSAIKAFQKSKALKDDGIVGPKTREALVKAYLEIEDTTVTHDDIPLPHGCEGHPDGSIAEAGLVEDDRRVEVFFFEKKIKPRPPKGVSHEGDVEYTQWTSKLEETQDFEVHGVHVRVVDAKKKAVANLPVKLVGPVELDSVTDDHGYASFVGLKAGRYLLRSAKQDNPIPQISLNYPTAKTVAAK